MKSCSVGKNSSLETQASLSMKDKLGHHYFEYQDVSSPSIRMPIAHKVFLFYCDTSNSHRYFISILYIYSIKIL